MLWLLHNILYPYPRSKYIWMRVRMRHETDKAVLVLCDDAKIWIPKSRIRKVKLRNSSFWIYIREASLQQYWWGWREDSIRRKFNAPYLSTYYQESPLLARIFTVRLLTVSDVCMQVFWCWMGTIWAQLNRKTNYDLLENSHPTNIKSSLFTS